MSGRLAKPMTPQWLDAQIGQEAWVVLGLSKHGKLELSLQRLEARSQSSVHLPIGDPKRQQRTPNFLAEAVGVEPSQIRSGKPDSQTSLSPSLSAPLHLGKGIDTRLDLTSTPCPQCSVI